MRRLVLVVLAAVLALPALAAAKQGPRPIGVYAVPDLPLARVVTGVATADATASGVQLTPIVKTWWKGPAGPVTVAFDASTRFRGQASAFGDLKKGDIVSAVIVAPRTATAAQLPPADLVLDLGPAPGPPAAAGATPAWATRIVTFRVWGRVTAADATSLTVRARFANRPARRAIWRARTRLVPVKVDPAVTRIRIRGEGPATLGEIEAGDRVRVVWRAPFLTALGELPAARRILVTFSP